MIFDRIVTKILNGRRMLVTETPSAFQAVAGNARTTSRHGSDIPRFRDVLLHTKIEPSNPRIFEHKPQTGCSRANVNRPTLVLAE
jgi:hypothetical protein